MRIKANKVAHPLLTVFQYHYFKIRQLFYKLPMNHRERGVNCNKETKNNDEEGRIHSGPEVFSRKFKNSKDEFFSYMPKSSAHIAPKTSAYTKKRVKVITL